MRYEVKIDTVLSSWFDIEADNEEEAKEKAYAEYDSTDFNLLDNHEFDSANVTYVHQIKEG